MATPRQRADLIRLEALLQEAFSMIDQRYWATRDMRASYEQVLKHIRMWIAWEEDEND
ncbi:hypothetical protein [Microbacterium alcoholitolerans]|uniref:hypothetical protein n=1 Tax=unclassified Microbacterium TaxID=2609290 RepID=UPI003D16EE46